MPACRSFVGRAVCIGIAGALVCLSATHAVLAAGTVTGNCWVEQVKGRPGAYRKLYEWNVYASIDGGTVDGHQFRVGLPPQPNRAYYIFPNPSLGWSLPGGTYSFYLDQPLFWGRPKVQTNVPFPASGTLNFDVELPVDYSCAFDDSFNEWGANPWEWSSTWYQTFEATGTSITGIDTRFAGVTADNVRMSIVQDNGGAITSWPQVGPDRTRSADSNTDVWVRYRSDEIPTAPGQRYALKLVGEGGGAGLGIFRRIEDGSGYALGQAYNAGGTAQNFDAYALVFSDNDDTVIPYVSRVNDGGALAGWAWAWSQQIKAKGNGLAGAVIYFAAETWDKTLYFRVHSGSVTGPQVGPTKPGRGASQAANAGFAAASWNPGEVPLTPGQIYYLEVYGGLNASKFTSSHNVYPDGHAYQDEGAQTGVDLHMQVVEYADVTPATIDRNPASFTRSVARGSNLSNDTFTIANSGGGVLAYTITDDASWLSVNPNSGSATTETDNIDIIYSTTQLSIGPYTGQIQIDAPSATNSPQFVTVNLTVTPPQYARVDHDQDGDVDLDDYGWFQTCFSGDGNTQDDPDCANARLDVDDDVDSQDLGKFMACLNGANVAADTTCTD